MGQKFKLDWGMIDFWLGIGIYFVVFEILGLILVERRLAWTLGLVFGCGVACWMVWHMFVCADIILDMIPADGEKYARKKSILRGLVMLAAAWIGMIASFLSFPAVVVGILSLKISAYMQPFTSSHITKKLRKEGR